MSKGLPYSFNYYRGGILKIGNVKLENNIVLSPMAGVTDLAYRLICKEMGAGLVVSEMVSSRGIYYNDRKTETLMAVDEKERPISIQIFGSEPEIMASVVRSHLNPRKDIDIVDINMGCPAPKIVKNGDGSALMKNPKLVRELLRAVVGASEKPVSLKIRTGWDDDHINCLEIAQIAEEEGISALTVHGRTREQFYTGRADLDAIRAVKAQVKIPVIGNGDIFSPDDAIHMLDYTGCDAIALGRGVQGNPWLFRRILDRMEGREDQEPSLEDIIKMAIYHLHLTCSLKGEGLGVREMRKHIAWYLKGLPKSAGLKDQVNRLDSLAEVEAVLWSYLRDQLGQDSQ